MTTATGLDPRIEKYLARMRVALRGLPEAEIADILRELRSHAVELASNEGGSLEAALESLGDPVDLAATYRAENQMVEAECSGSPLTILQGLRHTSRNRWARLAVGSLYAFGYVNVVTLWAAAIEKLIMPSRVGLWHIAGNAWSLSLVTDGRAPAGARELLGWWLVPIAAVFGWVLRIITDRIAQWWIRHRRRAMSVAEV
jgi:hypothetical protein